MVEFYKTDTFPEAWKQDHVKRLLQKGQNKHKPIVHLEDKFAGTIDKHSKRSDLVKECKELIEKNGFSFIAKYGYETQERSRDDHFLFLHENKDWVIAIKIGRYLEVVLDSYALVDVTEKWKTIIRHFPRPRRKTSDEIQIRCWTEGMRGGEFTHKKIVCPSFKEIRENYPKEVTSSLDRLINLEEPDKIGKVVIWHGPPGTGKTYCIRSLAKEWSKKIGASVEIVVDPLSMFGRAQYMNSVLLQGAMEPDFEDEYDSLEEGDEEGWEQLCRKEEEERAKNSPIRLIILEDQGTLFSLDGKSEGFDKFLNLTDGIIGQGSRIIFLITSNEEIDKIHPAVKRHGRCLNETFFRELQAPEVREWLNSHEISNEEKEKFVEEMPETGVVLADLYAYLNDNSNPKEVDLRTKERLGFNVLRKDLSGV